LEDRLADATLPASCDQFNRLHEALVEAFAALPDGPIHVAASSCNIEDDVQARYLHDCAHQARRRTFLLPLDAVGADTAGRLFDADGRAIECLVKVYRWELLLREPFGPFLTQPSAPLMIEPLWKLVLSSKGLLVWLWRLFPRHPSLLPCWFEDDPRIDVGDRYVVKPLYSIKGANVRLVDPSLPQGGVATPGPYGQQGHVVQALHRIAHFPEAAEACHASLSGWLVGGKPEGIAILEGDGPIIHEDTSRFVPHVVLQ
jgi:glutathionylspermidine synthase